MRPPILEWKVSLALFAFVIVAVALGGALVSTSRPAHRSARLYVLGADHPGSLGSVERVLLSLAGGSWTGYAPRPAHVGVVTFAPYGPDTFSIDRYYQIMEMTPEHLRAFCSKLKPRLAVGKWIVNGIPTPSLCRGSKHH